MGSMVISQGTPRTFDAVKQFKAFSSFSHSPRDDLGSVLNPAGQLSLGSIKD